MIDWNRYPAAVWRKRQETLRAVTHIDPVTVESLLGIESQKQLLLRNTSRFLKGQPANNALLWGARGTGKSALIKAMLNRFRQEGLRLIQVDKEDLVDLPYIVDDLRSQRYHFLLFCDDLSFEAGEFCYKPLKSILEGSIELPPDNVLVYATSNRRHLLPEPMKDNLETAVGESEIHYADAVEEKISLSDRFGLSIAFYPINLEQYLAIVDSYFSRFQGDRAALHQAAKQFSMARGSRSGRTARQFYNYFIGE